MQAHKQLCFAVAALAPFIFSLSSYGQCCGSNGCGSNGRGSSREKPTTYGDGGSSFSPSTPDPYGGQIFCPVTGQKLGLQTPPVPVQTTILEVKPSWWGKMWGKKTIPGTVIYVCCQDCVAKVQGNPQTYFGELLADKSFFHSYATAPAQRPLRVRTEAGRTQDIQVTGLSAGQKTCPVTGAELGSMGPPVPVTVGGQTIYVCCQGCVAKVQRNPDTYLRKVANERAGN